MLGKVPLPVRSILPYVAYPSFFHFYSGDVEDAEVGSESEVSISVTRDEAG